MGAHLINGEFQSDKYPTTPRGKVPLSVKDPTAQGLLWEYAQRRRKVDTEFSEDLEAALRSAGYDDNSTDARARGTLATAMGVIGGFRPIMATVRELLKFESAARKLTTRSVSTGRLPPSGAFERIQQESLRIFDLLREQTAGYPDPGPVSTKEDA